LKINRNVLRTAAKNLEIMVCDLIVEPCHAFKQRPNHPAKKTGTQLFFLIVIVRETLLSWQPDHASRQSRPNDAALRFLVSGEHELRNLSKKGTAGDLF